MLKFDCEMGFDVFGTGSLKSQIAQHLLGRLRTQLIRVGLEQLVQQLSSS